VSLVLDASAALPWEIADENDAAALELLSAVAEHSAWVPALWWTEMANALAVAERRARLPGLAPAALDRLARLQLQTDPTPPENVAADALALAQRHGLSVYDASYLELATRLGLPLATRDADLRRAARKAGVELL
jgi:predicted nucleic acid-binding protein